MIDSIDTETFPAKLWTPASSLEATAIEQIKNTANLPWVYRHVAIMADAHMGYGVTIGTVLALVGAVSPSAVGSDIGCGLAGVKTNLKLDDLPESLKDIRTDIEWSVPTGRYAHKSPKNNLAMNGAEALSFDVSGRYEKISLQVGTLGQGNHFIEITHDDDGNVWIILHSGSRNIGKVIADKHIEVAKGLEHNSELPDIDLAVFLLGTEEMQNYIGDLSWAQRYAAINRETMMSLVVSAIKKHIPKLEITQSINCHHNYVSEESHFGNDVLVTRKGAISAQVGELGIIPGSMGTGSYIVRGLGNPMSFNSASHGAGRVMSRTRARKEFTIEDLAEQTSGVECRKDKGVLDEIPGAYKDIEVVMNNQKDLVEVVAHLHAVLCVKG